MAVPRRREEQEPASDEIDEVAPGILRLQLPIHLPGLGHVNCYLLEDEHGVTLVDPGLPGPRSWRSLRRRLTKADVPLRRVRRVVVTHSHPDHFGGAGRLRRATGAEVVGHRSFRLWWDPDEPPEVTVEASAVPVAVGDARDGAGLPDAGPASRSPFRGTPPWGGSSYHLPWRRRVVYRAMRHAPRLVPTPKPTRRLDDADVVRLGGRDWTAVHTPGHTPDHLCLLDPAAGVLLSGDHVLPTITPHISGLTTAADPLAQFISSLERMTELEGVRVVLPAHGQPFSDLHGRARAIRRHHEDRLALLHRASIQLGRPATVMELSTHLFSPRAQGPMAESETYAHLEHLRLAGRADRRFVQGVPEYLVA